jgi:hypothetical protein
MIEFTANGLWFAPHCQQCFRTNKYLHHSDKICGHTWQTHRLDKTGDYILFPSTCWHKGFYHNKFKKTVIQVQLRQINLKGKEFVLVGRCWWTKNQLDFILGPFLIQPIILFLFVLIFLLSKLLLENTVGGSWACQFCPFLAKNSVR